MTERQLNPVVDKNAAREWTVLPANERWLEDCAFDVAHVKTLLTNPLSDDPQQASEQMIELDGWLERMNSLYADSISYYHAAKLKHLVLRSDEYTDLDRETMQKAAVINERRIMDILEGIAKAISNRLILGMALRKSHAAERQTDR